MTCHEASEEILSAEMPGPAVSEHLASCAACRILAAKLLALDFAVRAIPTPAEAAHSQAAFLQSLTTTVPAPRRSKTKLGFAWAIAAAILLAIGVSAVLLTPSRQVQAQSQVVDALVEWNLQLSEL